MLRPYKTGPIIMIMVFLFSSPFRLYAAGLASGWDGKGKGSISLEIAQAAAKEEGNRAVLSVAPREIDFGDISPDEVAHGQFSLKSIGGGNVTWFTEGPEGWAQLPDQGLAGQLSSDQDYLRLAIRSVRSLLSENVDNAKRKSHNVQLKLEAGGKFAGFSRDLPVGTYREPLRIISPGGSRTVFLNFRVTDAKPESPLVVEPPRLDFGLMSSGKQATRQIRITNKVRDTIKWRVILPKPGDEKPNLPPLRGEYVSFRNDDIKAGSIYSPAAHLRGTLETSGIWVEYDGYPAAGDSNSTLRVRFSGTGVDLYAWQGPEGGELTVYIDDQLIQSYQLNAPERGRRELPVFYGLPDGPHVMTLVSVESGSLVEGVKVHGKELMRGNPGWMTVIPNSGTTTRETDYLSVRIDTQQLTPGSYGEQIILASNHGDVVVEAFVEIRPDQTPKFLDVYRYVRNHNYLYTVNPQAEAGRLQKGGYRKEGIAFRLFAPGTPGTTEFYRWYNSKTDDHYYSYILNTGAKSMKDYVLEGSIGNIATSRLTNTKELYRWYNAETGGHFYTTDPKGEGIAKRGYKFDGIAGYVR